ncbi:response regulator transcription factor [Sphingomonas sp. ac-8]|uniref:response regulator transcription factor n=1 Tax=Sphingomonas sp. ac-8 TaxID=3242977 RepID=UPI003A803E30
MEALRSDPEKQAVRASGVRDRYFLVRLAVHAGKLAVAVAEPESIADGASAAGFNAPPSDGVDGIGKADGLDGTGTADGAGAPSSMDAVDGARARARLMMVRVDGETGALDVVPLLRAQHRRGATAPARILEQLSRREREVLEHLARGAPNKVIARLIGASEGTVRVHMKSLMRKLRVANRTQAAVRAVELGVASPPSAQAETAGVRPRRSV